MDEDRTAASIPYYAHEGSMARMERTNRRLWILILVLILALIGTNAGWIYYESQYEQAEYTVRVEQDTDGGGENNFNGNSLKLMGGDDSGETDNYNYGAQTGQDSHR